MLGAVQGDRMIVVLGGAELASATWTAGLVGRFVRAFAPGPVVIGPPVEHLMEAAASTREALSGYRAAVGWPEAPRPVSSHDLLPERALAGDGHARRALARELYDPLRAAGGGLLETLVTFLDAGSSVEAAARALFVHANTVRYRLRRIHEVSGYSPTDARDAYALRLALTLGRLLKPGRRTTPTGPPEPRDRSHHGTSGPSASASRFLPQAAWSHSPGERRQAERRLGLDDRGS